MALNSTTPVSEAPPEGWRFASEDDLNSAYPTSIDFRDYNGDGIQDKAYLAKSTKHSGQGLLVWLSSKDDHKWIVLDEIKWDNENPEVGPAMGIEVVKPQKMKTTCGKGYWECSDDEEPEITLINPGIAYFQFEGASSVYYWNPTQLKFIRVWISD